MHHLDTRWRFHIPVVLVPPVTHDQPHRQIIHRQLVPVQQLRIHRHIRPDKDPPPLLLPEDDIGSQNLFPAFTLLALPISDQDKNPLPYPRGLRLLNSAVYIPQKVRRQGDSPKPAPLIRPSGESLFPLGSDPGGLTLFEGRRRLLAQRRPILVFRHWREAAKLQQCDSH